MFPNNHPQDLRYRKITEPNTSSSAYTEVRAGQLPRQATAPHTPVGRLHPVLSSLLQRDSGCVCPSLLMKALSLSIARAFGPVAEQRLPVLCEETVTKTGGGRATGPFCALDGRGSTATHLFSVSFPCPRIPLDGRYKRTGATGARFVGTRNRPAQREREAGAGSEAASRPAQRARHRWRYHPRLIVEVFGAPCGSIGWRWRCLRLTSSLRPSVIICSRDNTRRVFVAVRHFVTYRAIVAGQNTGRIASTSLSLTLCHSRYYNASSSSYSIDDAWRETGVPTVITRLHVCVKDCARTTRRSRRQ
jgi:hypothetical protein